MIFKATEDNLIIYDVEQLKLRSVEFPVISCGSFSLAEAA